MSNTDDLGARIYPCNDCGKMRTKAEGGTTFTVCDECWDKNFGPSLTQPPSSELLSAAQAVVERWDSPAWKDLPHTGEFINRLRVALAHPKDPAPTVEAQAIGEQTPVAWMTASGDVVSAETRGRWLLFEEPGEDYWRRKQDLYSIPLYRSPMSSEARDKAISALESYADSNHEDQNGCIYRACCSTDSIKEPHDGKCLAIQALSALRGE